MLSKPSAFHSHSLTRIIMSRRGARRRRGAAAAARRHDVDVARPPVTIARSRQRGSPAELPRQPFPYICVLDVEATCDHGFRDYIHEIIEFPVVIIDMQKDGAVAHEFHSYVRPTINTTLTEFCTELTGITQQQVDAAPTLAEVLAMFEEWRMEKGLMYDDDRKDFIFAADGPWDLRYFLHGECTRKGIAKAAYFDKWCNVKQLFADFYHLRSRKIHKMLEHQGLRFEGRLHSGIDDTRNIARIVMRMRDDGAVVHVNEALPSRMRHGGPLAAGS
jgi:3'-5' exoribonuclease 1